MYWNSHTVFVISQGSLQYLPHICCLHTNIQAFEVYRFCTHCTTMHIIEEPQHCIIHGRKNNQCKSSTRINCSNIQIILQSENLIISDVTGNKLCIMPRIKNLSLVSWHHKYQRKCCKNTRKRPTMVGAVYSQICNGRMPRFLKNKEEVKIN